VDRIKKWTKPRCRRQRGFDVFVFVSISRILFRPEGGDSYLSSLQVTLQVKRHPPTSGVRPCT